MAKRAAKDIDLSYGISLEEFLTSVELGVQVETPVTTAFADGGPRRVEGNYDYSLNFEGGWDGASGAVDASLFGHIGSGSATFGLDPTGATAGSADPNYDGGGILSSYTIRASQGQAVTFAAQVAGTGALARNTA